MPCRSTAHLEVLRAGAQHRAPTGSRRLDADAEEGQGRLGDDSRWPISSVAWTMIGAVTFGQMCRRMMMGTAIVTEAALSFLGVGVQPPTPSWGAMLRTGSQYLEVAPWIGMASGAAIFVTVLAINFVGDGFAAGARPASGEPQTPMNLVHGGG